MLFRTYIFLFCAAVCSAKSIYPFYSNLTGEVYGYHYPSYQQISRPVYFPPASNYPPPMPPQPPSQSFYFPASPPPRIMIPPFALDHYYCSAQASFALISGSQPSFVEPLPQQFPWIGSNFDSHEIGSHSPSSLPVPSFSEGTITRQFCRHTATITDESCESCCKIAARHYTTSIDEVKGVLFRINPSVMSFDSGLSQREKRQTDLSKQSVSDTSTKEPIIPTVPFDDKGLQRTPKVPSLYDANFMKISKPANPITAPSGQMPMVAGLMPPLNYPGTLTPLPMPPMPPVPQCFCCAPRKYYV